MLCMTSGHTDPKENIYSKEIILAKWEDRFVAWLVDFILVAIIVNVIFFLSALPSSFPFWGIHIDEKSGLMINQPYEYIAASSIFFVYWLFFEYFWGQTLGKKIVNIKITNLVGEKIDIKNTAIESFGKSFLLPVDFILGLIFSNKRRQRIFNKVSKTVVIKLKKVDEDEINNIKYVKDH